MVLNVDIHLYVRKKKWRLSIVWNTEWRSLTLYKNYKPIFNAGLKPPNLRLYNNGYYFKHQWFNKWLEWELGTRS